MRTKRSFLSTAIAIASAPMLMVAGSQAMAYGIGIDLDENANTVETLEVYGVVRLSYDYGDSDVTDAELAANEELVDGDTTLASNTSILGLKGSYAMEQSPYTVLWQIEQAYTPDESALDELSARDTYLGLKTPIGLFRAGYMDTPFKIMGLTNSTLVSTAGDPFAILGIGSQAKSTAGQGGIGFPRVDLRGSNSLYYNTSLAGVRLALQYGQGAGRDEYDNDSAALYSGSLAYTIEGLTLSAAAEKWNDPFSAAGVVGSLEAWRLGAKYATGPATVGVIYGDYSTDPEGTNSIITSLEREEYGVYGSYKVLPMTTLTAQWMHAGESEFTENDDADQFSVAVTQQVFPRFTVHAVYTQTQNGENAAYGAGDYAHGETVLTTPGNDPSVFSVGAQYSF